MKVKNINLVIEGDVNELATYHKLAGTVVKWLLPLADDTVSVEFLQGKPECNVDTSVPGFLFTVPYQVVQEK